MEFDSCDHIKAMVRHPPTLCKNQTHRDVLGDARGDFPGVRLPMGLVPMLPLLSGTLRLDLLRWDSIDM